MLSFFTLLPLLVLAVVAAPTADAPYEDESKMLARRDVSSQSLYSFNLWEQYAAAAYCSDNNRSPATKVACAVGKNCPLVESLNTKTLIEFENVGITDSTGFVAIDNTNKAIVISIRGSTSVRNWLGNFDVALVPVPGWCKSCAVHGGFLRSFKDLLPRVQAAVDQAKKQYPDYNTVVTGHSLGGAVATLLATELRAQKHTVALYTYGSPHVGENFFANFVSSQPGGNYRLTHANDIVPQILAATGPLYRHIAPEYHITSGIGKQVQTRDIEVLEGVRYLPAGNLADFWPPWEAVLAHTWYFGEIAKCYGQVFEV